jgi:hypothetical protein
MSDVFNLVDDEDEFLLQACMLPMLVLPAAH